MTGPYTVTLLQLQPDVSGHAPGDTKHELGRMDLNGIVVVAGKLQHLPPPTEAGAAPGIIVRRGEKAWRISAHQGRLRVHHGTSALDDYWTADTAAHLADLPPFRNSSNTNSHSGSPRDPRSGKRSGARTAAEVVGLLVVGLVLVYIAAHFGMPRRKLSAPPAGLQMVSNAEERGTILRRLAGTYAVDKKPGADAYTITPDGIVQNTPIGKDGKPTLPPRRQEQAQAVRLGDSTAVWSAMGAIIAVDENTVKVGNRGFKYTRLSVN